MNKINLGGNWKFCLDKEKKGMELEYFNSNLLDNINLPTTVSESQKGTPYIGDEDCFLTDPYRFEGYSWYSRDVELPEVIDQECFLVLERTRTSHVWVNQVYVGTDNSLCTSHRYRLTPFLNQSKMKITIMIDNTSCPVKGGHMTSQDTQTNWNGITGGIYLDIVASTYLTKVMLYPDIVNKKIQVKVTMMGSERCLAIMKIMDENENLLISTSKTFTRGENCFNCDMGQNAKQWNEHSPILYKLKIKLITKDKGILLTENSWTSPEVTKELTQEDEIYSYTFGLREFKAVGNYFEINGRRTFLRGKHDGLIFPRTGYAPTDLQSWLTVLSTAKAYGINHYRFHTCCPPEAAFTAADMLGIYMEPELPFWGTVTEEGEANHDERGQQYLITEGFRILEEFGNHPSFVMMSLGNELWGSKNRLNEILGKYKEFDYRHLYTQGSNNFQFTPTILANEDFFCGVRFSRERLFRGSYAMCDAPQGHIQTEPPNTTHNYNEIIRPNKITRSEVQQGDIIIQHGIGTKTVKVEASEEVIPQIPVISHEIGQYAMYPDYSEIEKYTGVLKARNFEVFRERLKREGMLAIAEQFFRSSGKLAVECYKAELETALRSSELAGFQLLDLQDFSGQGTALVGVLNAFMESKGLISELKWREFCSDTVILAELSKLVFTAGERITIGITLANYGKETLQAPEIVLTLKKSNPVRCEIVTEDLDSHDTAKKDSPILVKSRVLSEKYGCGVHKLCSFNIELPKLEKPALLELNLQIKGTDINNHYELWVYPEEISNNRIISEILENRVQTYKNISKAVEREGDKEVVFTDNVIEAIAELKKGRKVLLFPRDLKDTNSISGTYCTDFWCYPMFRSISESMNRPLPIGTLGLLIDEKHPAFEAFPTKYYTTPQWYDIISNSRSIILDDTGIEPIVWSIDNFERNHRLGLIFELKVGLGRLLVCGCDLRKQGVSLPARWLMNSIHKYMCTGKFNPKSEISSKELMKILCPQISRKLI